MDKFHEAIEIFKMGSHMSLSYQGRPIVVTYSGGKDSDVLIEVAKASGEPFEVHNNHTTVDAPPTVYHIREKFKKLEEEGIKCHIEMPTYKGNPITMWSLIPLKLMPPTRLVRYCCSILKEKGCADRVIATGIRWSESTQRSTRYEYETVASRKDLSTGISHEIMLSNDNDDKREIIEQCKFKNKIAVNPIIAFEHSEIWDVIHDHKVITNPMYEMGYERVGCIGCPMARNCGRAKEFADFPTYKIAYIKAFQNMIDYRKSLGKPTKWKSGEDCFLWWMEDENIEGQLSFDFDGNIYDDLTRNY